MIARKGLLLCALAGMAGTAFASDKGSMSGTASRPAVEPIPHGTFDGPVNHVYINLRTGERTITPLRGSSCNPPFWSNIDIALNGNNWIALDDPTAVWPGTTDPQVGGELLDWGDIPFDSLVDGYRVAYVSDVGNGTAIAGFTLINWWYDNDNGFGDPSAIPVWGIGVSSIPGGTAAGLAGWILTIDLCGTGLEFELGDTDGSFTGITGGTSSGGDKDDTDGCPWNDFSYSYSFDQAGTGLALGNAGPFLVVPAFSGNDNEGTGTGAAGNSDGVEDALDLYDNTGAYLGTFNFGGWVPAGATPFASIFMELCGAAGPNCCIADYNGDTVIDINDQLDFFDDYANCENQPGPCGSFGDADINGDTVVDIQDQLDFFDLFGQCTD